jgi:hypothetical protein
VRKPEGRSPLRRPKRRLVDNIRMDLVEMGLGDVDWIGLAHDRDRWRARVNSIKCWETNEWISRALLSSIQLVSIQFKFRVPTAVPQDLPHTGSGSSI